jgi:branched-chain amino acid transport system permease protein
MESFMIGAALVQDGITTGAIYALLGMATVLLFVVTRVIFLPQGEMVVFGALTMAMLQEGKAPGTVWLLAGFAIAATLLEVLAALRDAELHRLPRVLVLNLAVPLAIAGGTLWIAGQGAPMLVQGLAAVALVTAMGPLLYRVVYRPLGDASVLVLMIVSVGVHFILNGLALLFFGVDGFRTTPFWDESLQFGDLAISGQSVVVVLTTAVLIGGLWLLFDHTLYGKALRASASNATGARLVGIPVSLAGSLSFGIAAFLGALCGVLIAPVVTIYYDSGLLIGLKGFVAAIFGGLASYPLTLLGAIALGIFEAFVSFWASAYKDAVVFLSVIPVLLWLSLRGGVHEEEN